MEAKRIQVSGETERRLLSIPPAVLLLLVTVATPAGASPSSRRPPDALECHVRSAAAEARGDILKAVAWAVSFASLESRSSYAACRVARLYESLGEDSAALNWGGQALALDSLNSEAAMLVGRFSCLFGTPEVAVRALSPPLRGSRASPELFALRALAHELSRDYPAALADLWQTGPLLEKFDWIATGILGMALEEGRLREAYSAFQLAITVNPDDARTLALGVSLAQRIGDPKLERSLLHALRASEVR